MVSDSQASFALSFGKISPSQSFLRKSITALEPTVKLRLNIVNKDEIGLWQINTEMFYLYEHRGFIETSLYNDPFLFSEQKPARHFCF